MVGQPKLLYLSPQKWLCAFFLLVIFNVALYSLAPSGVYAATFYVDTLKDDGSLKECTPAPKDCSLRGAILKGNEDETVDTITLGKGRYNLTNGELHLTTSMHIIGAGAKKSVVDGKANDRVFRISGLLGEVNVAIEAVTVTGGKASDVGDEDGGGIKLEFFSTLTLTDSLVTANRANDGAGLHLSFLSTAKLFKSTIMANVADDNGGGIHLELNSTATLTNSHVIANQAASGGGIFNAQDCNLAIAHSTIRSNVADEDGGGIHNNEIMFITHTFVTHNHADADKMGNGNGGAIYNTGAGTITHSHINKNTATNGGGIFSMTRSLGINHSTISRNRATGDGGGLFNEVSATLAHSAINKNVADRNGGGIFNNGIVILDHTPIRANAASLGNAVYNEDTLILMGNITFAGKNVCKNGATGAGCP